MTISADPIEEYLNTEDIVYISSLPTPEEKESAIFSRITTLPTVQVRINPGQTETPIKNSIPTYRNLSTDTINNCDLGEKIQIAISEQGGCFNIEDLPEITTIEELLNHLCEVLIRFDTDPNNYLKDDYTVLLKTICNSLIHLYLHENEIDYNKALNKPRINDIELVGNKTSHDLNLADANHNHDNLYGTKQEILDLQSSKADASDLILINEQITINKEGISDLQTNKADKDDVIAVSGQVLTNTENIEYLETNKQDKLLAGKNIVISGNVISADLNDYLTIVDATDTYETIENVNSLSDIVSGHTRDISNKADKATMLSGYNITDAYTKTEIDTKISSVFRYKGNVPTYVDLIALTGMTVGDVYNVTETGSNYVWTSTEWDDLSGEIDLSAYLKTEDAATIYETIENVQILSNTVSGQTGYISDLETNKADKADVIAISGQVLTNIEDISDLKTNKQDNLTAGENIVISDNVISADLNDYLTIDGAINTYETIENVQTLSDVVSGHTGDIESLEANKADTSHTHTKSEVGLSNVDNTSDLLKPISNATQTALNSKANTSHTHIKSQVGLENVDNTSDAAKPVSTATQTALNGKANTVHIHTKSEVGLANVDNTSDLLKPISTATQTALNSKADTSHTHTKAEVGLANVDNTSDANKPVSNATQTALNSKANTSHTHSKSEVGLNNVDNTSDLLKPISTATQSALNSKANTLHTHTKSEVGLSNVDNTTDANKPISNATQTALNSKANTVHIHTKSQVELENVDNTSDINKPVSNATQTALNGKANTSHTHTKSEVGLSNVDNTSDLTKPISTATQTALNSKADKADTLSGYGITDAYTKTEIDINLENYKTYSGFENRTDSTISINQTTGVFTLAPTTTSFNVWTNGTGKHEITTTQTKTIVADQTISYLYIDENGVLQLSTTAWNIKNGENAPCSIIFKDGTHYTITDERHSYDRNREWHNWAHSNIGTMYHHGLVGTFTNTTLSVTQGVIADEDIVFDTLNTKTKASLWYRNGASGMRMVRNSATPYSLNGATIQYDNGSGTLQPVGNNKYTCSWVYCANDSEEPIYVVIGQNQYNTQTLALSASGPIINLSTAEWKLLYKVIYQNKSGIATYVQTVDYRTVQTGVATTPVTPTSHANLTERDAANSHPATAISIVPPSGYTSTDVQGLNNEIATQITNKADKLHTHTKAEVGLANVDNTSDLTKPISTATQTALNGKANTSHTHTKSEIGLANVDNTSDLTKPISTATQTALDGKANTSHTHTKSEVGLGNVDNTSDAAKPVSTATQTALNGKANTVHTHTKSEVGLSNVDNTTDANKPISNATQTALNDKANTLHTHTKSEVGLSNVDNTSDINKQISNATQMALDGKINTSQKGVANGVAQLDNNGIIPSSQLPSYVDDVLEYTSNILFPTTGESGKIYLNTTNNLTYRWTGSGYAEISPSIALGETASTAYAGDKGKTTTDNVNAHIINAVSHITSTERTNWNSASTNNHVHTNKTILDNTNASYTTTEQTKLSGIETNANKYVLPIATTTIGGVKSGTDITVDASGNVTVNDDSHNHIIANVDGLQATLDGKVDDNQVLTNVPINAKFTDTIYTHPSTHAPSIITQDSSNRFVTDVEKSTWNGKATQANIDTSINAIEVGGRNLIPNTKDLTGYPYRTSDTYLGFNIARATRGATGYVDTFSTITPDIAAGSTYVASFYAKASVTTPMACHWYSPNTTTSSLTSTGYVSNSADGTAIIQVTTEWKKYWVVWTQTLTELPKRLIIGRNSTTAGAVLEIAGVKLEKGNKATDWTPALEDQVTDWNVTDVNSFAYLKNKPTTLSGYGITDAVTQTALNSKANISHTHTKSEVGLANVDNTSDLTKPISTATQTALNLKASQSDIETAIDAIEIGGRNYVIDSERERVFLLMEIDKLNEFTGEETITLSFEAKYVVGGDMLSIVILNEGINYSGTQLLRINVTSPNYTKYSQTITLPASLDNLRLVGWIGSAGTGTGYAKKFKVEKGNKATDWTPAPEDINEDISDLQTNKANTSHTHTKSEVGLANVDNTSDVNKPISNATQTALNSKAPITGVPNQFIIGRTYNNVFNKYFNTSPTQILIKTGCNMAISSAIIVKISGYVNYSASIIDLQLMVRFSGGIFGSFKCLNSGPFNPNIQAFTYVDGGVTKLGFSFKEYLSNTTLNISVEDEFGTYVSSGWSSEDNAATGTYFTLTNPLNPSYVSNFASKINGVTYNGLSDITIQDITKAPTVHTHNALDINAGDLSLDRLSNMKKYIASRGENLVTNGTGLLKNNTNFSSMTYTGAESYNCDGSFTTASGSWNKLDELMPVNPDLAYKLLYYIKAKPWVGASVLAGVACFDTDGLEIMPYMTMYYPNTLTTLALDLKDGDTTVKFTNLTNNWVNVAGAGTYIRTLIFWNYIDSYGKIYPELSYSRNSFLNSWDPGAVNYATNTITLNKPWSNGTIVAGTKVSNGNSGNTYKYLGVNNYKPTTEWTAQQDIISGIDLSGNNYAKFFHPGTASVKLVFMVNRDVTGGQHYISNISFGVYTDAVTTSAMTSHVTSNLHLTEGQRTKLEGIAAGAEVNVQSDWNAATGDAQILNKPTSMPASDVSAWAKAATKPSYVASDIGGLGTNYRWLTDTYINTWNAKEPAITKLTAFNKDFGTTAGTISEGNHAHTFASLTSKPNTLSGYGITDAVTETIPISWSALKSLRDAGTLVPGQVYRITDYVCTTTTNDSKAVNNLFDIVITALDEGHLSENANVIYHESDTYFENAKLEVWEIKYCIDNDTTKFAWADTANGKGVIYYMKDEWNNECPYDFKNIQFKKSNVFLYTFGGTTDNSLTGGCHHNTMMDYISSSVLTLNFNTFGNWCSYNTFGNVCSSNTFGNNCGSNTFGNNCYSNTFGDDCSSNTFGNNCFYNTFGDGCSSNTFGDGCSSNTFGNDCNSNTLGDDCYSNMFGNNCFYNTFGDGCSSNTFGDGCSSNTFGNNCLSNTFGNNCNYNTFGDNCSSNTFGDFCGSNTFGDGCGSNTFGNDCNSNTFGNDCNSNTFGNNCNYNTFGDNCYSNKFYVGTSGTTKKDYISYIVLEDGCRNNNFYSTLTTSDTSFLQRIRIKGLDNTTPTNTQITLSAVNTKYEWVICYTSGGVLKQYCPDDYQTIK